ncbi:MULTISPECIES: glycoside hydrolase family 105 protein [unclassified Duganella]|uniref:glycoside hydrolase family 88/105 protein n=1 Tax=unclassified Duganella TaxID=2636909 RepID=UPI00088A19D5|nr:MULTISPECIES: glycoside hydrolase family 88 protein [unclassified Duganella]SDF65235.1 Rhamnogalacturonyl hydrolase YesR [Duganella sp. OV458]SDI63545.1 Rhamnogalacturonyl hydrolase YesR [Duganella sp. OV510]
MKKKTIYLALMLACATQAHAQQNYPQPTPEMQAIIDKDTSRFFGDAPADGGSRATGLSPELIPAAIDKAMRKVADWQLERTMRHLDKIWTSAVLFSGFMAVSESTGDPKYRDAMLAMANGFEWKLRTPYPNADDIAIAQTYLELYFQQPSPERIAPTREQLDTLISLKTLRPGDERQPWWWCDALFMAPPVWVKMYKATGERKYLDYVHTQWRQTYDLLYDKEEHLYARDASYKSKREANGKKIFWSRGEGWVMGGLARTLDYIPADDPQRPFYIEQLQQMAARIAQIQGPDGQWHAGLLDPATYPLPETSGAALFVYGMAYGVNKGYLDAKVYRPVIERAWAGLLTNIYADGRLGGIQQTGAEPAFYRPTSSFNYGVGGFLLAASELKKMAKPQS